MNPPSDGFTVHMAGQAGSHVQRLIAHATTRHLRPLLREVFREMKTNLEARPRDWGDPYYNYPALDAVGYGKTILAGGLRIVYVVHDTEPLVWITAMRPLAGSPFA